MDVRRILPAPRHLAVFFLAGVVLITETVLFHAAKFVVDYALAMTVIGCAVSGIGLGALIAARIRCDDSALFSWCCGGITASLYVAAFVLLRYPLLPLLLAATGGLFVFPGVFIARMFSRSDTRLVYCWDMVGAGAAVAITVLAYRYLGSEEIFLVLATVIPLFGALGVLIAGPAGRRIRILPLLGLLCLTFLGAALLFVQTRSHAFNIARLVNDNAVNIPDQHVLRRASRWQISKTYDCLEGRIDAIPDGNRTFVTYDGFFNDNFYDTAPEDYADHAQRSQVRFPQSDRRVVYGLVPEPHVFVVGAAADGILKTLREITPLNHIDAVEINPGIMQMMKVDFLEASGRVYDGLNVMPGNALTQLQRSGKRYDIITLINTHSSRWIGTLGPPDYLHTRESYDLFFDHLSQDGYLLFEERPTTPRGELGIKRMILTLYDCLRRRGAENPADHFFIWEFMSNRYLESGGTGIAPGSDMYYVGMVVSLQPFRGKRRQDLLDWCEWDWTVQWDDNKKPVHYYHELQITPAYLKDLWQDSHWARFFELIEQDNFSELDPHFDATIATDDRPFLSCASLKVPEIERLLWITSCVCLCLVTLITIVAARRTTQRPQLAWLICYNLAIGCAFFFIEIVLIQRYQSVFLSPSTALVLVLGTLLIGSGIGGLTIRRIPLWLSIATLGPVLALALFIPSWLVTSGLRPNLIYALATVAILLVGLDIGAYFPHGLIRARQTGLKKRIPHLFAINSVAGSLASVYALYFGIRLGYTGTLAIGFSLYLLSGILLLRVNMNGSPQR